MVDDPAADRRDEGLRAEQRRDELRGAEGREHRDDAGDRVAGAASAGGAGRAPRRQPR